MTVPNTSVGDSTLAHLRLVVDQPDVSGTRYELRGSLGSGGMGVVWRAWDTQLEREVALKVLAPGSGGVPTQADGLATGPGSDHLVEEAKVLARLEHPGIVPVHDVGRLPDGRVYYAMKLVRGRRLDELLKCGLPHEERFRLFSRICEAVAFAHSRGVVHRDLKPANIMVGEFGEVLVLDWGLAKLMLANSEPGPMQAVGTAGFMAPEQELGEPGVDARADVFSLGRLLATLAIPGKPLMAIVMRATAKAPGDRYAAVDELARDVERFRSGAAVSALPESLRAKLVRCYRNYRVAVWLVGSYAVLRIGFEIVRLLLGAHEKR